MGLYGWKRWLIFCAIAFPIFSVASVELTSQSWFCNSCHIMNPYYDSWRRGPHKDVECVKCHISPGVNNFVAAKLNGLGQVVDDVLYRTSPKPSASVSELACTRSGCHDITKVRETKKESGTYLFRHDKHLDLQYSGMKLQCGTCHSHIKGDQHFEVNTSVCVTCHLLQNPTPDPAVRAAGEKPPAVIRLVVRDSKPTLPAESPPSVNLLKTPPTSCKTCHNPPAGTIVRSGLKITHSDYLAYGAACESCHRNTTVVPAPIADGQCLECHNFGLERLTSAEDIHQVHAEGRHKIECFSCHGTIQHGPVAQTATLDQFDCRKCHQDQHAVQRGTYLHADDTPAAPAPNPHTNGNAAAPVSPMFLAHVDCTSCHIKKRPVSVKPTSGALVAAAVPQACDACHKPGLGEQMIPLWQKTTHSLYDAAEADLKALEIQQLSPEDSRVLEKVRSTLEMVRVDGSWGVHNPRYTQQLLEEARNRLMTLRGAKKDGGS
jgi:nitrate/TMAO reductase-like tetraheme cytochrome c subunit